MLLIGVCSLSAGDVTLLPRWIRVAILVRQPILDLISDWFHIATFSARLNRSSWCITYDQTFILWDAIFLAVQTNQSIFTLKNKKGSQLPSSLCNAELHSEPVLLLPTGSDMPPTATFLAPTIVANRLIPHRHVINIAKVGVLHSCNANRTVS